MGEFTEREWRQVCCLLRGLATIAVLMLLDGLCTAWTTPPTFNAVVTLSVVALLYAVEALDAQEDEE